ncbi:uncharacterized protein LOC125550459 isoform X5 [Triticum urartu]|uniref:uncharacterized protein LOC125550459 isoform X5 n=1 Tax=Triticum urartu TaxID=4572 RepID=UPI0020430840|nr:uncharacterized protein LOC125550459 isoform X5 [Triticum urartu]
MAGHEDAAHDGARGCVQHLEGLDVQVVNHAIEVHLERPQVIAVVATSRGDEKVFLEICYRQAILQLARQSGLQRRDGGPIAAEGGGGDPGVSCCTRRDKGLCLGPDSAIVEVVTGMDNQPIFGVANVGNTHRGHHHVQPTVDFLGILSRERVIGRKQMPVEEVEVALFEPDCHDLSNGGRRTVACAGGRPLKGGLGPVGFRVQCLLLGMVEVVLDEHDGEEEIGAGPVEVAEGLCLVDASEVCHKESHETLGGPACNLVPGVETRSVSLSLGPHALIVGLRLIGLRLGLDFDEGGGEEGRVLRMMLETGSRGPRQRPSVLRRP